MFLVTCSSLSVRFVFRPARPTDVRLRPAIQQSKSKLPGICCATRILRDPARGSADRARDPTAEHFKQGRFRLRISYLADFSGLISRWAMAPCTCHPSSSQILRGACVLSFVNGASKKMLPHCPIATVPCVLGVVRDANKNCRPAVRSRCLAASLKQKETEP
jgi:hypothetical protein